MAALWPAFGIALVRDEAAVLQHLFDAVVSHLLLAAGELIESARRRIPLIVTGSDY